MRPRTAEMSVFVLTLPLNLQSVANLREHWARKAKRANLQRYAVALKMREFAGGGEGPAAMLRLGGSALVRLIRVMGPRQRAFDDDNLRSALKAIRDEVAKQLGANDGPNSALTWEYGQRSGYAGHRKAAQVVVEIAVQWRMRNPADDAVERATRDERDAFASGRPLGRPE